MTQPSFSVTDAPPQLKRGGGGRRAGENQFRQALEESYNQDFKSSGDWYEFQVEPKDGETVAQAVKRACDKIRAAGQIHPKVGTEVRKDNETGLVAFRGKAHTPRRRSV